MSKGINVPTDYTIHTDLSGDVNSTLTLEPITATTTSTLDGTMTTTIDATTTSSMAITQLPTIQIGITHIPRIDIRMGMAPTRIHMPVTMKFAICALGTELLSFVTCGESMVIIEDYVPHCMEKCA